MNFNFIKRKRVTIITLAGLFLIFGLGFSLIGQFKYSAESKVLVYQKFPVDTDIYSINRSNEYLSSVLTSVIGSDSFYDEVMKSGYAIDSAYFTRHEKPKDILKAWSKTVTARPALDLGIIEIKVYHPIPDQAMEISRAVNFVLVAKNQNYHGGGDTVVVKVIDKPAVSAWPTRPNLPFNSGLAILTGLIIAFAYIYLFPEERYDLSFWPAKSSRPDRQLPYGHRDAKEEEKEKAGQESGEDLPDFAGRKDNWHGVASVIAAKRQGQLSNILPDDEFQPETAGYEDLSGQEAKYEDYTLNGSMENLK